MNKYAVALYATALMPAMLLAQQVSPALPVAGAGRQTFVSPEVHADHRISFRLAAPTANDVQVRFAGTTYPATRDANNIWTVTVGPVEPEIYNFNFVVGGANVNSGMVEVPGSPPRYDELQNVPHGSINLHAYYSKIQNRQRNLRVYVPPQYYTEPRRRFPVLFLWNGQDEVQWTTNGRINVVLDNLIAQRQAVPMIIVMPNNTIRDGLASSAETVAVMEKELPGEIMPMIEQYYRVLNGRENRAIAGLSFGGGTAFGVGMRNLGMFAYVGEFGSGTFGGLLNPADGYVSYLIPYDPEKIAPGIYRNLVAPATRLRLFYMSCGVDDPRLPFQKAAAEDFRKHGIEPVFTALPGRHDFKFFRRALADFVSRLFK